MLRVVVSGHSSRLKLRRLQVLSETEMLQALTLQRHWAWVVVGEFRANDGDVAIIEEKHGSAICDEDVAKYIVEHLGANVGHVSECVNFSSGPTFNTLDKVKVRWLIGLLSISFSLLSWQVAVSRILGTESGQLAVIAGEAGRKNPALCTFVYEV